ncbi:MAG TPA: alpha/beta hydrolase [Naasia sp.]|jgi:pimeloyl-ACP methyl ester carboxylesterase
MATPRTSGTRGTSRTAALRRAGLLLLTGAMLPALTGCIQFKPEGPGPEPTRTSAGPAPTTIEEYYAQDVAWEACDDFECAEVQAPTDWADPTSEPITLALIRQPALGGTAVATVFVNPGGPGGSGVGIVQGGYAVTENAAQGLDVVGWDPRGVGASTPVVCADDEGKDEFLYGTYDAAYETEEWIGELEDSAAEWAEACYENTGELLAHIDTASTARDLDMLRAVVAGADSDLTYLGYSYGTQIGATYAELFPENVGRMVLDGAVDPTVDPFEALKVQYTGFESALRAYVVDCLRGDDCPFEGTVNEVLPQIDELMGSVDGQGLTGRDGREFDSATFSTGVALALYSEQSWPDLSTAFAGVMRGDVDPMLSLADVYNERTEDGDYTGNSVEVYNAVGCVDDDFTADAETTLDRIAEIEEAAPIFGRYFAFDDYAILDVMCSNWPVPPAPQPEEYDAAGAPPILVVGTTNDPATPYVWAQSLADQLESGVLISYEGEGHTIYNWGVACIDDTVDAYLLEGEVPASDPRC